MKSEMTGKWSGRPGLQGIPGRKGDIELPEEDGQKEERGSPGYPGPAGTSWPVPPPLESDFDGNRSTSYVEQGKIV